MKLGIKATVDVVFKKVFGSRDHPRTTLSFLNAILAEIGRTEAKSVEILNPYELGRFAADKDSVLDIKFKDESNRTFQVEMQVRAYPTLKRRMLGNWASIYSGQLAKGQRDSENLPVIAIWLVGSGFLPPSTWLETWTAVGGRSGELLHGDFLVVAVDLGRWKDLREQNIGDIIESRLDQWLFLITESEQIDPDDPPLPIAEPEFEEAIDIMAVFTKKELERDRYNARLEFQRMMADMKHDFREEGLAEGRAEGDFLRAQEDARNLKRLGVAIEIITEATGLSKELVESL